MIFHNIHNFYCIFFSNKCRDFFQKQNCTNPKLLIGSVHYLERATDVWMVCVYMMMEKQSPIMIGLYNISSLSSCCLLFLVKRPILCHSELGWAVPWLLGQCVLVHSVLRCSQCPHGHMTV